MDFAESAQKAKEAQREFILTELNIGLTFAVIAKSGRGTNQHSTLARAAYDSAHRFINRVDLTNDESGELLAKFEKLKGRLEVLGETFPKLNRF